MKSEGHCVYSLAFTTFTVDVLQRESCGLKFRQQSRHWPIYSSTFSVYAFLRQSIPASTAAAVVSVTDSVDFRNLREMTSICNNFVFVEFCYKPNNNVSPKVAWREDINENEKNVKNCIFLGNKLVVFGFGCEISFKRHPK